MQPTTFFKDGKRKIDYVLVYCKADVNDDDKMKMLSTYEKNIRESGLEIEVESGLILEDLICLKVHASKIMLTKFADACKMELSMGNPHYKYHRNITLKFMRCILTCPNPTDPLTARAPDTLSGKQPTDFTNAERMYIVRSLLSQIKYDDDTGDVGFQYLLSEKVLLAAYPLHDSLHTWTTEGPLSDRQLLAKYWASLKCIYKEQPLTLIERYYGPTVAFYFAWAEFYSLMLVPAAFIGLLCFGGGIIYYAFGEDTLVTETCSSDKYLCPVFMSGYYRRLEKVQHFCTMMKLAYIIDNPVTIIYSILMTFWGATFVILWNRKQSQLNMRFNLNKIVLENEYRPTFKKNAKVRRVSSITGKMEYFNSLGQTVFRKFVGYMVIFLMLCLYFFGVIVVLYIRITILYYGSVSDNKFHDWYPWMEPIIAASMTFTLVNCFEKLNQMISYKITSYENPRTQSQFDRKFYLRRALLSFGNVLMPTVYIAFFKGNFYTHPREELDDWTPLHLLKADSCKMSGCLLDLGTHVAYLLILGNLLRLSWEFTLPFIQVHFNWLRLHKRHMPLGYQWEEDFVLVEPQTNSVYSEYIKLLEQYSFMTLFLVSLPLAPVLAVISCLLEIRLDAIKILKKHRRIVMKKVAGIGEWFEVIKVITFLGTISNPLLIAFSSNLISRAVYWIHHDFNMTGYLNSTLSEFFVEDYPRNYEDQLDTAMKTCYYVGKRYPPSSPQRYKRTEVFWYDFAIKSIFFILLENTCLLAAMLFERLIPPVPRKVELKRELEECALQKERLMAYFKI